MTLTVADIDRWSADAVREVFHAARMRAEVSQKASYELSSLSIFQTWGGTASEAAKTAFGDTSRDLEADANDAMLVARAASKAADDIDSIKDRLRALRDRAHRLDMAINPATDTVVVAPGARMTAMEAELKMIQLQPELDAIVFDANAVDAELANTIALTNIAAVPEGSPAPPPLKPRVVPVPTGEQAPPPRDSQRGGGYWSVDRSQGFDAPAHGPVTPWQRTLDPSHNPALRGAASTFEEVVAPNWPGKGAEPIGHLQESYKFRLVGERFTGAPDHVHWFQENGKWYQAKWIDYQFEGEHVQLVKTEGDLEGLAVGPWGRNAWEPMSIQQIYGLTAKNPRLTLYIPDICGPPTVIGAQAPAVPAGIPVMTAPR